MKARSALFTLFGDVIRPAGGEAWLSTITALMADVGVKAPAVRTALHRMSADGWVAPRKVGRYAAYRLTDRGVGRLEEAAERIYRLRSRPWDGRWRMLLADLSGHDDVVRELEWVGFGRLDRAVWVSPHEHPGIVDSLLADVTPRPLHLTAEAGAGPQDDTRIVSTAWDLTTLAAGYLDFHDRWRATSPPPPEATAASFAQRLRLVHEWRRFLFADPGLPEELLPAGWPGRRAAAVFRERYELLAPASWERFAALQSAGTPDGQPDPGSSPTGGHASPFAQGLAALGRPTDSSG